MPCCGDLVLIEKLRSFKQILKEHEICMRNAYNFMPKSVRLIILSPVILQIAGGVFVMLSSALN